MPMRCNAYATALCVIGVVLKAGVARAGGNLRSSQSDKIALQGVDELEFLHSLLQHSTRLNFSEVEDLLVPILSALPEVEPGYAEHRVARYALVRYFLVYRGWHIKGLSRFSGIWNDHPVDVVYESKFPPMVLRLIEEILMKPLIGIQDITMAVAAVEALIYSNAESLLTWAYDTMHVSVEEPLRDPRQQQLVLTTFATFMYVQASHDDISYQPVEEYFEELREGDFNGKGFFADLEMFVVDTVQAATRALANPFSKGMDFAAMMATAVSIISGKDTFQHTCLDMKHTMMDAGGTADGRLPLAKFYQPHLDGDRWEFAESSKYLGFAGALDVGTRRSEDVIIPNYVHLKSNCWPTSSFHQECCVNECEILLLHVESAVRKPYVGPVALLEAVAALPSDTVRAPRNLSDSLRNRLFDISRINGGAVPLHGRMFSEWMHRAFPNECPAPADNPLRLSEFNEEDRMATQQERDAVINRSNVDSAARDDSLQMSWTAVEELLSEQEWETLHATKEDNTETNSRPKSMYGCFRFSAAAVAVIIASLARLPARLSSLSVFCCGRHRHKALPP